jgi:hypothetical protein
MPGEKSLKNRFLRQKNGFFEAQNQEYPDLRLCPKILNVMASVFGRGLIYS